MTENKVSGCLLIIFILSLWACSGGNNAQACRHLSTDTTLMINGISVDINFPEKVNADLLLLPGWNFPRTDWCEKTSLCKKAKLQGFRLIMPEMGKSVYHSHVYPETRTDWLVQPTGKWLWDTLIPLLQKNYCILLPGNRNFVAGISTGGRGAALAIINCSGLFTAGAALSGDFDQEKMPGDNLMTGYYGAIDTFPERWKTDNPNLNIKNWKTPFYLAHGLSDTIVPAEQTLSFYHSLQHKKGDFQIQLHTDSSFHDYQFWDSQTDSLLIFFNSFIPTAL